MRPQWMATVSPAIEQAASRRDLEAQVAELQAAFARLGRIDTTTWQPTVTQNGAAIALTRNWAMFQVVGGWCHFNAGVTLTAGSTGAGNILIGGSVDGLPASGFESFAAVCGTYRITPTADAESGALRFGSSFLPAVASTAAFYTAQLSSGALVAVAGSYPIT